MSDNAGQLWQVYAKNLLKWLNCIITIEIAVQLEQPWIAIEDKYFCLNSRPKGSISLILRALLHLKYSLCISMKDYLFPVMESDVTRLRVAVTDCIENLVSYDKKLV